jgi:hypothetical protein
VACWSVAERTFSARPATKKKQKQGGVSPCAPGCEDVAHGTSTDTHRRVRTRRPMLRLRTAPGYSFRVGYLLQPSLALASRHGAGRTAAAAISATDAAS